MSGAAKGGRLKWYARRLASMSAPEITHRVIERAKQFADGRRRWGWDAFPREGAVGPLPAFDVARAPGCLTPEVERHARDILNGDIELLSARWPKPAARAWWRTDLWTLDPASGQHWPGRGEPASKSAYRHAGGFGDVKFVWELNRLHFLMPLAVAARRDQDEALAAEIADVIDGWMDANPPYDGINWTNGIEAASRVVVVLVVNSMIRDLAPARFQAQLAQFIAAHVWILARYPSLFSSANNHRVAELCALYLAYGCAPSLPDASSRGEIARELESEALKQFHADGVGAEQSPTYAAYSLEWFLLAALMGEASGAPFSAAYAARLKAAALHLRWLMDESGRTPAIGDDDEGRVCALGPAENYLYPAAVSAAAARWLGDGESAPPAQAPTLLDAFVAKPAPAPAAPMGRRTFVEGGYSVWRAPTAHGTMMLAFDHAPLGFLSIAAHGHADALSVWLSLGGEEIIIDAGTYLYHTDSDGRDRFRGTLAHNTLCLDGQNQSHIAGPFNWSAHAAAKLVSAGETVTAEHDGYLAAYGVRHQRSVRVDGRRIEVTDTLEGALSEPAAWSLGFTLHPRLTLITHADGVEILSPSGAKLRMRVEAAGAKIGVEDAEMSPGFGRVTPTKKLVVSGDAASAGPIATTWIEMLA